MEAARAAHLLRKIGAMCLSFGLIGLGVICSISPNDAAKLYGLPTLSDASAVHAWVQVAGLRDFGLGCATLAISVSYPQALRVYAPTIAIIPIGDAYLTYAFGGSALDAAAHIFGTVAIGILSLCAWLDPALSASSEEAAKKVK